MQIFLSSYYGSSEDKSGMELLLQALIHSWFCPHLEGEGGHELSIICPSHLVTHTGGSCTVKSFRFLQICRSLMSLTHCDPSLSLVTQDPFINLPLVTSNLKMVIS